MWSVTVHTRAIVFPLQFSVLSPPGTDVVCDSLNCLGKGFIDPNVQFSPDRSHTHKSHKHASNISPKKDQAETTIIEPAASAPRGVTLFSSQQGFLTHYFSGVQIPQLRLLFPKK